MSSFRYRPPDDIGFNNGLTLAMQSLKSIVEKQQETSPGYFDDPEKTRMMQCILSLGEEVCVLRDRLDTCARLAKHGKTATDENINSFDVTDTIQAERLDGHTRFFEKTLASIRETAG